MFDFLKNMFSGADQSEIKNAINEGAFLVDVRNRDEFVSGHAKNTVNIPLGEIQKKLDEFKNKKLIVVFCRSGNRSAQAKSILEQNGIKNVLNGGTWNAIKSLQDEA
jgi:phage shock protein E